MRTHLGHTNVPIFLCCSAFYQWADNFHFCFSLEICLLVKTCNLIQTCLVMQVCSVMPNCICVTPQCIILRSSTTWSFFVPLLPWSRSHVFFGPLTGQRVLTKMDGVVVMKPAGHLEFSIRFWNRNVPHLNMWVVPEVDNDWSVSAACPPTLATAGKLLRLDQTRLRLKHSAAPTTIWAKWTQRPLY